MEKVLVDAFIVPEESREAFLEGARRVQGFLKTLPGSVEGFLLERKDGEPLQFLDHRRLERYRRL